MQVIPLDFGLSSLISEISPENMVLFHMHFQASLSFYFQALFHDEPLSH